VTEADWLAITDPEAILEFVRIKANGREVRLVAHFLHRIPAAAPGRTLPITARSIIMKNVTIRRCPTCSNIISYTDQLTAELRNDPDVKVNVVDGSKGEFTAEVDGRRINGKNGDSLRDASEAAAEIRGQSPIPA